MNAFSFALHPMNSRGFSGTLHPDRNQQPYFALFSSSIAAVQLTPIKRTPCSMFHVKHFRYITGKPRKCALFAIHMMQMPTKKAANPPPLFYGFDAYEVHGKPSCMVPWHVSRLARSLAEMLGLFFSHLGCPCHAKVTARSCCMPRRVSPLSFQILSLRPAKWCRTAVQSAQSHQTAILYIQSALSAAAAPAH